MRGINRFVARRHAIRAQSRDMRVGLGYQRYDALWRFASIPRHKRRADHAKRLLSRPQVKMQVDPGAYFRSPAQSRDWEDWQEEEAANA